MSHFASELEFSDWSSVLRQGNAVTGHLLAKLGSLELADYVLIEEVHFSVASAFAVDFVTSQAFLLMILSRPIGHKTKLCI